MNTLLAARISWHLGTREKQFFVVGATLFIVLSSIPSLYLLDATIPRLVIIKSYLQMVPDVSWGAKSPSIENYHFRSV